MTAVAEKSPATMVGELDRILFDTEEPERSEKLEEFLAREEPVKLKAASGTMKVRYQGKEHTIGPAGKVFTPGTAINLLWLHGRQGIYRHMDQHTGMTAARYDAMSREDREYWEGRDFKFEQNYLYHAAETPEA